MATFYYTQKKLGDINQSLKAIAGATYIQSTGVGKGASYKGQLDGTLKWISDNFTENTTEVVNGLVAPAEMSSVDDTNVT